MKLKRMTEDEKINIASTVDNEGFWYALTNGFLNLEDILDDVDDIRNLEEAIDILSRFESILPTY